MHLSEVPVPQHGIERAPLEESLTQHILDSFYIGRFQFEVTVFPFYERRKQVSRLEKSDGWPTSRLTTADEYD